MSISYKAIPSIMNRENLPGSGWVTGICSSLSVIVESNMEAVMIRVAIVLVTWLGALMPESLHSTTSDRVTLCPCILQFHDLRIIILGCL